MASSKVPLGAGVPSSGAFLGERSVVLGNSPLDGGRGWKASGDGLLDLGLQVMLKTTKNIAQLK
jgi:hypothetical protein